MTIHVPYTTYLSAFVQSFLGTSMALSSHAKTRKALIVACLNATEDEIDEHETAVDPYQFTGEILSDAYNEAISECSEAGHEKDASRMYEADRKWFYRATDAAWFEVNGVEEQLKFQLSRDKDTGVVTIRVEPSEGVDPDDEKDNEKDKKSGKRTPPVKLPETLQDFTELAKKVLSESERGVLAMALMDSMSKTARAKLRAEIRKASTK